MRTDWRVTGASELTLRFGNTTPGANCSKTAMAWACFPFGGPCIQAAVCKMSEVPAGTVQAMEDGKGGFEFLGTGVHFYCDMFMRLHRNQHQLSPTDAQGGGWVIRNGDRTIVPPHPHMWCGCDRTVEVEVAQGMVGLAMDMGQPILLPPAGG
eukprot:gene34267-46459_t